jgi:hypothetical protein
MGRLTKWLLWIGGALAVAVAAVLGVAAYYLHRAEPMLRAALVDTLQKRFQARVELASFHVSVLDGFWAEAGGLRIWLPVEAQQHAIAVNGAADQPWVTGPWITAEKIRFHAKWARPGDPILVSVIHVEGVKVLLPPKEDRGQLTGKKTAPAAGPGNGSGQVAEQGSGQGSRQATPVAPQETESPLGKWVKLPQVLIGRVECVNVDLVIEKGQADRVKGKIPLDFALSSLVLTPDGKGGPVAFEVVMTNPKPVGQVHSTGHVGPIAKAQDEADGHAHFDPGALPLDGDYHFDHADLSTIKGIAGMLSSTGHYVGTLRQIAVDGHTDTPDFRLERIGNGPGVPLTTNFHAIVDGTSGDTQLDPVDATLGHTHFVARGKVVRVPEVHGHDIQLQVTLDRGRIEDILHISASAERPFMTGNLTLDTSFHLPPGPEKVFDKLELDGRFHLSQARFSNEKMQGRIEELSLRGQGKPHEVKTTDPTSILSDMQGHFKLGGGVLVLPDLEYQVPGAAILVEGKYGLSGGTLDFAGNARMDAKISQMVGGWKGLLLKPADRFLSKNGAGTDVPIHLEGTRKEPKFGVDFDRIGKADAVVEPK